ncbi:hypothetical protein FNU79_08170 [Deinococcus detaillensis]|uniref:Uncharacterized protein n=1 Tax=Deinococcus detaillensis TaxID=2592048 RepID=A0A553V141_9DEIO|nr:hypothetical protein [Deinococcus detaillensis]TSA86146.1 hypothetical protein FNU79_08170 [Deinococcus detaillensis]
MADLAPVTLANTVPTFDSTLQLSPVKQINFRGQEPWGRWLLGKQAKLIFSSTTQQQVELDVKLSLPYEGQWIKLILNGDVIFRATHRPKMPGEFKSQLLIDAKQGTNQLEFLTNRSNLGGEGQPFAKNDSSDISISLNLVSFQPLQTQAQVLYGPQPSSSVGTAYSSAGAQGLERIFAESGPSTVSYKLLRRFEKQGFTFTVDGKSVHTLPSQQPGNLLVGSFNLPRLELNSYQVHVLRVSSIVPPSAQPFPTTAKDGPDVQFYVQQLQIKDAAPSIQNNVLLLGLVTALLIGLLWLLLFRLRRS